jgi:nucleoid DNA-binding protein
MGKTKKVIADTISEELRLPLRTGRKFLQRVLDIISDDIVNTGRSELREFGAFVTAIIPAHTTIHPGTGKPVQIPARKLVRFRASARLRHRMNPEKPASPPVRKLRKKKKR